MSLNFADRVKETTNTTGTGTYSLSGSVAGFQGFVAGVGSGNTCEYCVTDSTDWEVGIGTVTAGSPDTVARTTILRSSNAGAAVSWGAGAKTIFASLSADTVNSLVANGIKLGTSQATTSGTTIDFTGIPPSAKKVTISFFGVSTNGSSNKLIQIGTSGGVVTSGYIGVGSVNGSSNSATSFTAGFGIASGSASHTLHGAITLSLLEAENPPWSTWVAEGVVSNSVSSAFNFPVSGSIQVSGALDRVRVTTSNGADAFDAGRINISYE